MATIIKAIVHGYHYLNDEVSDPRTKDWFLIGSPWGCIVILASYLYFVYTLGPRLMETRQPYKFDRLMQIYNAMQIVLNARLLYKALTLAWLWDYSYICEPVDFSNEPKPVEIAATVWFYFMVKVFDLLDTVFFVLRKKQNQVSFLHVYHHAGMVLGSWGAAKYLPGGHVTFLGLVNAFVHMVMYSHYLATSLKLGNAWWKKYITQLQLAQFILLLIHFSQLIWTENCDFPAWPAAVFIPQNLFMIVLFSDFYYKTYVKKPRKLEQNGIAKETSNGKSKEP